MHKCYMMIAEDIYGNKDSAIYEDGGDEIGLYGLRAANGVGVSYQDDAKHVEQWCEDMRIFFREIEICIPLEPILDAKGKNFVLTPLSSGEF